MQRLVAITEVTGFVQRCMEAVGAAGPHAASLADLLLAADTRGHYSHGLNRLEELKCWLTVVAFFLINTNSSIPLLKTLPGKVFHQTVRRGPSKMYVREVEKGSCDGTATPTLIRETPATAYVDGRNAIGPTVAIYCMDVAIKKAKEVGIGWVTCVGSNHFGIAGYYTLRAVKQGLLGMAFTNTSPCVVPTRAKQPILGTNPISVAAPAIEGDSFVLDMATSTAPLGKVEMQHRKEQPMPKGWGVDESGTETADPGAVLDGGGLMPLGGSEITAGYKGYGLAMMVEMICGVLGGGPYAHHIREWTVADRVANLCQTFVALDPGAFAPNFEPRMRTFMQEMRQFEPADPDKSVLVAGDPERMHEQKVKEDGGVWYHDNVIIAMNSLAERLNVTPLKVKSSM